MAEMQEFHPQLENLAYQVIGAAIEVHRALGPGYLESVYEEAMCVELELRQIAFKRQYPIAISYKGRVVGEGRIDLWIEESLIVELKAIEELLPIHKAQVISYLNALDCPLGLLINFREQTLKQGIRRIVLSTSQ